MKTIVLFSVLLILILFPSANGQLSDKTGLKERIPIETGGYRFEVEVVANFEIDESEFSADEKKLTLYFTSQLEDNVSEIIIPTNLINGEFTFFLDDQEIFPVVKTIEKISFITIEFQGEGSHQLDIIGTTYLPEFAEIATLIFAVSLVGFLVLRKSSKKLQLTGYSFNKD